MFDLCYYLRGYSLSSTAILVYGVLDGLSRASLKRGKPYVYISRASIGERIGKSERTARRAVKELERANLIVIKRMGRNLNDHIFVFAPKTPQDSKEAIVETANHSVYMTAQKRTEMSAPYSNTEKVIKNNADISILPDNEDKGRTQPKGKPTPKRMRINVEERQRIRKHYRDYFRKQLGYEEYKNDMLTSFDDADALSKIIDFMANTMANKGQIYINGTLITPQQWFYVVKNIEQDDIIELIAQIPKWKNVRKPQAYLLACLYNSALHSTLLKPWYSEA